MTYNLVGWTQPPHIREERVITGALVVLCDELKASGALKAAAVSAVLVDGRWVDMLNPGTWPLHAADMIDGISE